MTKHLYGHYNSGGRILAFPGYQLYGKTKKQILSEPIMPWEILEIIENDDPEHVAKIRKQRIIVVIDEVTNFINNHFWQNKITDVIAGIAQQRRKLNIAMSMTGHERLRLPPNIEEKVHEEITCMDAHRFNHDIPIGQLCYYRHHDLRGMLSHPRYPSSKTYSIKLTPWYKHYDTFSLVSVLHMFDKYKFEGREIRVGADGKIIEGTVNQNMEETPEVTLLIEIASKVEELKENGIDFLSVVEYGMMLGDMGLENTASIKKLFRSRGLGWDTHKQGYVIHSNNKDLVTA